MNTATATAPDLTAYDVILVNSSAGKDSQAMLDYVAELAKAAGVLDRIIVVHADLGRVEWAGTRTLAEEHARHYGFRFVACSRSQDLLDQVEQRGMWPDKKNRYCTSDHKRDQIRKVITALVAELELPHQARVLNCLGIRAEESPERDKMVAFSSNKRASSGRRLVEDWLPIHTWTLAEVWARNTAAGTRHHEAYDLGMPRLSCVFCVFAPKAALMIAGRANPALLKEYVAVEARIGHKFRVNLAIADVQAAIDQDQEAGAVASWTM